MELLSVNHLVEDTLPKLDKAYRDLNISPSSEQRESLLNFYKTEFGSRLMPEDQARFSASSMVSELSPAAIQLQSAYISKNGHAVGEKDRLLDANAYPEYDLIHKQVHPYLSRVQKEFGFYDVFLISTTGDVVYSVFKEIDFGTSLESGPFRQSGLADAYRQALTSKDVTFNDFSLYLPSYQAPAGFLSTPVHHNGQTIGVVVVQFPIDDLNTINRDSTTACFAF